MRRARCSDGLLIWQFSTNTLRIPPETSLPIDTPPWPSFMLQLRTIRLLHGTFTRRPSAFLPDLIAMQSSPVLNVQFSMSTSVHDSGSHPSLFGPCVSISTLRIVTFRQSTGFSSHIGEFLILIPSIRTLVHR